MPTRGGSPPAYRKRHSVMQPATLTTPRLILRPFRPQDADNVERFIGDWDVARMLARAPYPYPKGSALAWIATHDKRRADGSNFPFAIELDDMCIGCVVLRQDDGAPWGEAENPWVIGYWLAVPHWGHGLMTEAARAVVGYAFADLDKAALVSGYFPDNPASGRVLDKLGFTARRRGRIHCVARGHEVDHIILGLTRDAWAAKQV